jgi:excinuclease ABC subunit C
MEIASKALEFEKAAQLRDSMISLEKYNQKMKIVANKKVHRDVFAIETDPELTRRVVCCLKSGKEN